MRTSLRERWRGRHRIPTTAGATVGARASDSSGSVGDDLVPEQVYHDAALTFLTTQVSASDALDSKANQALTVGSAALPLTVALVNVARAASEGRLSLSLDVVPQALFVLALGCYLGILVLNLRLGQVSTLEYRPDMAELRRTYLMERQTPLAGRGLKRWVADAYVDSIAANQTLIQRKIRIVSLIQVALALEGGALAVGAAWTLLV